jgi:hypothetical protein
MDKPIVRDLWMVIWIALIFLGGGLLIAWGIFTNSGDWDPDWVRWLSLACGVALIGGLLLRAQNPPAGAALIILGALGVGVLGWWSIIMPIGALYIIIYTVYDLRRTRRTAVPA